MDFFKLKPGLVRLQIAVQEFVKTDTPNVLVSGDKRFQYHLTTLYVNTAHIVDIDRDLDFPTDLTLLTLSTQQEVYLLGPMSKIVEELTYE